MRTLVVRTVAATVLVAFGYFLGSNGLVSSNSVKAQDAGAAADTPSDESIEKIKAVYSALQGAVDALAQEGRYNPVTKGINVFAITVGGIDAKKDLETGRGVDPETFAALYAGQAIDEIEAELTKDDQGRLMYKNKVLRMYPISRLKARYQERLKYEGKTEEKF